MPFTITHPFISTRPDSPSDIAAGKVTPTRWNLAHTISGALGANEVTNIPAGSVTSTDVQAAINQLASLIPAPGPGTDPLTLVNGLTVNTYDPTIGNPTDRHAASIFLATDCNQTTPAFSNNAAISAAIYAINGQNTNFAATQAKQSFFACNMSGIYNASGQKFVQNNSCIAYGMGDSAIHGRDYVQYAGGPVGGDEGQGWGLVSNLTQQPFLNVTTITNVPAQSVVNTTTTQIINQSMNIQTVNVVNTAGAVNGDWVIIGQEGPSSTPNLEAVQIISFTPTSITGVFRCTHALGVTVTPALVLICNSTFQMGQDRVLVNMSQPSYSAGTVSAIVGAGFTGLGTAWANNMVGGNATNIGAISLAADDYTGVPFDAGANRLRSWYQISVVASGNDLGIYRTDTAGAADYRGKGPGAGTYVIRPCARVLRIGGTTAVNGELICETSTSTWSVGDTVEQVICPYVDVTGFQWLMSTYANGGTLRSFMNILNNGARTIDTCIEINTRSPFGVNPTSDTIGWGIGIHLENAGIGILSQFCKTCFLSLTYAGATGGATDAGNFIHWGSDMTVTGPGLGPISANSGLTLNGVLSATSPGGALQFADAGTGINPDPNTCEMVFGGYLKLLSVSNGGVLSAAPSYILIERVSTAAYERGFVGWNGTVFEVGTQKNGAGNARDLILMTDNTERIRLPAAGGIKFTDPADFSANGGVATSLTGVGPAGSHTTVQKWLTIVDDTGATVYIPCF